MEKKHNINNHGSQSLGDCYIKTLFPSEFPIPDFEEEEE